jgi:uncharacterized protein YyaL (SSP411 family)
MRRIAKLIAILAVCSSSEVGATEMLDLIPEAMPGAPEYETTLRRELSQRLRAKGSEYVPRTRNLRKDGSPLFTNRLLLETSPYLQQHAHNPVNWHPWGDEAFETARKLHRPVLISIGYSTCHWCHVMEEESFDDPELARYLNQHFIAIKIDRETRPDVDAVYMAAIQAMGINGGWPLNVFVTPDRKPFYGGTYFPPVGRGGRPSFRNVLVAISDEYQSEDSSYEAEAEKISKHIRRSLEGSSASSSRPVGSQPLERTAEAFISRSDQTWRGMNRAPKFPSSLPARLLLRYSRRSGNEAALTVASLALEKMAAGGIHDQVGGGFHRYSTDKHWLVPHFEKMLYDNALLAQDYLEGWQLTGRDDFAEICKKTLRYVTREMTSPQGAFFSATDADSMTPHGESEEGWFFTWTPDEIEEVLGSERASEVTAYYGVTDRGNFESRNIFRTWRSDGEVAKELGITVPTLHGNLEQSRQKLYDVRSLRPPPLRDDKILVAWNGLMISAFARAGFAFDDIDFINSAAASASFILERMFREGRLDRVYQDGQSAGPAFLEDYAFLIKGLLDLYEAQPDPRWLESAIELQAVLDRLYRDDDGGGYFKTATDAEKLLAREKTGRDGAIPSGNSIAALNLLRLHEFTGKADYSESVNMLFSSYSDELSQGTLSLSEMYIALDFQLDTPKEVIVVSAAHPTAADRKALDAMLAPLRSAFLPNRIVSVVREGEELTAHAKLSPMLRDKRAIGGKVTAFVCENRVCQYPTSSPSEFAKQIDKVNPYKH